MTTTEPNTSAGPRVDGRIVDAFVDGVDQTCGYFGERATRILESHGIEQPQAGESHSLQGYLDAIYELRQTTGPNILNRVGTAVPSKLQFSTGVRSIEDAFRDLNRAFAHVHDDGAVHVDFEAHAEGGVLVVDTPYPTAFERGFIEGVGKEFGTNTGFIAIDEDSSDRTDSDDVQAYDLTWWETRDDLLKIGVPDDQSPATASQPALAD